MSVEAFTEALIAFQQAIPHVGKDNTADTGKYKYTFADLTAIYDAAFPLLGKHGFAWICKPTMVEGEFVLSYSLKHVGGWSEDGHFPLPDRSRPMQDLGSGITYARRYAFCAVTGIAPGGEDDDGKKASEARSQPQQRASKPTSKPPLLAAKDRVWASAEKLGWSKEDVAINYARDHEGQTANTATADELNKWAEELEADLVAAS